MKKISFILSAICILALSSCKTSHYTATEVIPTNVLLTNTIANLEVGNKMKYTYQVPYDVRKGGIDNVKKAAIAAMLQECGNADVIVAPEYVIDSNLTTVTILGRPANYTNFKSVE